KNQVAARATQAHTKLHGRKLIIALSTISVLMFAIFSHSKIHQFFLGSIATTIFRNATVPLLVAK
ncbi:hypothetical protein RFW86_17565, partial [Acinetobacter sp. 11367]|nr:hypothetical protein [Acinetobacter sp. 11367]